MNSRTVISNVPLVIKAIRFAEKFHRGQVRKGTGSPYYYHPVAVGFIIMAYKRSRHLAELICAAILHDTLEDTDLTFERITKEFGVLVASLVQELTNDEEEIKRIGKLDHHKKKLIGMSSYGLYLKLADRLHNVSDYPSRKTIDETLELMAHLRKHRKLSKGQQMMVKEIVHLC
jgi:(p)ppGpp synthase/HD superfamily hydrolase